jgi:tyrosine-protein kinase Etk/Wzc
LPPNPADLLDSERFVQMQRELQEQGYDHVIFDSPPVLAVADPSIMAGRMDAVVMVVRAGCTPRDALAHAVKKLQQVRARVIGAVMNCVDEQEYYNSYGYTKVYDYGDREESVGEPVHRKRKRSTQSVT